MTKNKLKLTYDIKLLGLYDKYGEAISHKKFIDWASENCKGKWNYYSPDSKQKLLPGSKKIKDWPVFYDMIFYFSHKRDLEKFKKTFT